MTNLNQINDQIQLQIDAFQAQINAVAQQLKEMQSQFDSLVAPQAKQKQVTDNWNKDLKQVQSRLRDAMSVYKSPEVVEQMRLDLNQICDQALEEFENYKDSNRMGSYETTIAEDGVIKPQQDISQFDILIQPQNNEDLPDKNDDEIILNHQQLKTILTELDPSTVTKIQEMLGISKRVKTVSSIAFEIKKLNKITYRYLTQLIELSNAQNLLLNGNGKH